ncbi:amino acid adenylation domain-containing protein [Streptomyces roseifaciens]
MAMTINALGASGLGGDMKHDSPRAVLGAGLLYHARRRPDGVALTLGKRDITYAEAAETALRWAALIVDANGAQPRRVGILAHRSEVSYLGVLAALYAGAAFVPLNRRFPVDRTRAMADRAGLDALIVDEGSLHQLPEILRGMERKPIVLLPQSDASVRGEIVTTGARGVYTASDLASTVPLVAPAAVPEDGLAYLLFTSGSTGVPKGVPVTHGNVRAFLGAAQARYGITPDDRLSQTFDQTFDLSVFDLFMAWEHGARICAMDPIELLAPFRYLERHEVTVWFSVPSVAAVLRRRGSLTPGRMPTLRWSLFCGEALPQEAAEAWQAAAPGSVVENLYGPTELTIACTAHRWDPVAGAASCVHGNVPIGLPFPGLDPLVVDERLKPVATGETGELCMAGPQTVPGYWQDAALTVERFFERDGRRYYRTGDMVRFQDGHYVHLGRDDQQVKVGGYRVELGEIEAALRRAGCAEAVCLHLPDEDALVAVVTGVDDPAGLADAVGARLPAYMVPKAVRLIDQMPVNGNGKADRQALRSRFGTLAAAA